jgi:Arc/MetJ-type ribon-helix-helix transcriptional regulator
MTTVRLPAHLEAQLNLLAETRHRSKSELIVEALERLFQSEQQEMDAYELGKDLFGRHGSGGPGGDYKQRVKEKLRDQHRSR